MAKTRRTDDIDPEGAMFREWSLLHVLEAGDGNAASGSDQIELARVYLTLRDVVINGMTGPVIALHILSHSLREEVLSVMAIYAN